MALNASGGTPVSPGALTFFAFLTALLNSSQGTTLGDLGKEGGASGTLGIEHLVEAGGEYGHVLICIGSTGAVGETHCHRGLLLVMGRLTFR